MTRASRFWNASGIDVDVDAGGFRASAQSIAAVLAGGIAFANTGDEPLAEAAEEGQGFVLFDSREDALAPFDGTPQRVRMVFEQSPRGLVAGAPVDLLGVEVGNVRRSRCSPIRAAGSAWKLSPTSSRAAAARARAVVDAGVPEAKANALLLKRLVESGLRAQVQTGNLVTGYLYVALAIDAKAAKASIDEDAAVPTIPSLPGGSFSDVQPQLAEIVGRLGKVRFEEIGKTSHDTSKSATRRAISCATR